MTRQNNQATLLPILVGGVTLKMMDIDGPAKRESLDWNNQQIDKGL